MSDPTPNELAKDESPYNSQVRQIRLVHDSLMIAQVVPDMGLPVFQAGQYATLGLGDWEPCVGHAELGSGQKDSPEGRLIRRAYSISCPLLNERGDLATCHDIDYLEFYISRIAHLDDNPPRLTPRLFALRRGSRLYVAPHVHGTYTLGSIADDDTILFLATGTGEAPHNAMIAELLRRGHRGRILSAVCVRYRIDLAYLDVHRELERRFANYRYIPLTTREPENVDPGHPDFVGKYHLQELVASDRLESEVGVPLIPDQTHVYLCGNPDMIGLPPPSRRAEAGGATEGGMVDLLTSRGFRLDRPDAAGNIHYERYW